MLLDVQSNNLSLVVNAISSGVQYKLPVITMRAEEARQP